MTLKNLLKSFSILFILVACHNKKQEVSPMPDATFSVSVTDNNIATFSFKADKNDVYTFDFGDGERLTGSVDYIQSKELIQHKHIYRKNGGFTATLSLYNKFGTDQKQKTVEAKYASVSDFSYEVLDDGRLKLKNLSQNAKQGQRWLIGDNSFLGNHWLYTSTEQAPVVDIDLNGTYEIKLEVPGEYTTSVKLDTVHIKNARHQMTFSGFYQGKPVNIALNGLQFRYKGIVRGGVMETLGLYQQLWDNTGSKEFQILSKLYPFPNQNSLYTAETTKEGVYATVKKLLTKENDPDIIEVTEENLNLDFYNYNNGFFPKAFWVKYKIKNEQLDGELNVRILIQSLWFKVE